MAVIAALTAPGVTLGALLFQALDAVIDKAVSALPGVVYDKVTAAMKKDEVKSALQLACREAIDTYSRHSLKNDVLVSELRAKNGFLHDQRVVTEITKLFAGAGAPNVDTLLNVLTLRVGAGKVNRNFVRRDMERLLALLEATLRKQKALVPFFTGHDTAALLEYTKVFMLQVDKLDQHIIDFDAYMLDKTDSFTGREWVFNELDTFVKKSKSGYFFIIADPGIGKSALLSKLALERNWCHHFNQRRAGINTPEAFLKNICAQLILRYELDPRTYCPINVSSSSTLEAILRDISAIGLHEPVVILVDALDEVDDDFYDKKQNPLFLPAVLPDKVFFVCSRRNVDKYSPYVNSEKKDLFISANSIDNKKDVVDFITQATARPPLSNYLTEQKIERHNFIQALAEKSEYNFMYLVMVLPMITTSGGIYHQIPVEDLPSGLKQYYHDHWRIMKDESKLDWFKLKLPTIVALSVEKGLIDLTTIQKMIRQYYEITGETGPVPTIPRIREVLDEFSAFVNGYPVERPQEFKLYHESFYEFIRDQNDVKTERLELEKMNKAYTSLLLQAFNEADG
ncbi:MAG TPA: ATP-binding protein [Chryseosolibacter sp.]